MSFEDRKLLCAIGESTRLLLEISQGIFHQKEYTKVYEELVAALNHCANQ